MVITVRVTMRTDGSVTRHYVVSGYDVAMCGRLTLRPPSWLEHRGEHCVSCQRAADRLHRRGGL